MSKNVSIESPERSFNGHTVLLIVRRYFLLGKYKAFFKSAFITCFVTSNGEAMIIRHEFLEQFIVYQQIRGSYF